LAVPVFGSSNTTVQLLEEVCSINIEYKLMTMMMIMMTAAEADSGTATKISCYSKKSYFYFV
jgi:hypothetical protein